MERAGGVDERGCERTLLALVVALAVQVVEAERAGDDDAAVEARRRLAEAL